jgi:putative oxidoreductase
MIDLGLLLARLVFGLLMAAHGAQKLFGWFGGYGLTGTGGFMEQLGFRPGRLFAFAAAFGEVVSGLLLAFGLLGPTGPAVMLSVMIVAAITVHGKGGLFAANNGIELPLLYAAVAVAFAFSGFGRYSIDALLGLSASPATVVTFLIASTAGAFMNLALRRQQPATEGATR